jgi:hypothetical protein
MNQALEQAERVLAVLSAAYFGSAYTTDEWTSALVRDQKGRDRLLPVRIRRGTGATKPPPDYPCLGSSVSLTRAERNARACAVLCSAGAGARCSVNW